MAHIARSVASLEQQRGSETVWHCGGVGGIDGAALRATCAALSAAISRDLRASVGARVALLGLNTPEYLAALLAATDAGCIAAPLNWRWSAAELAAALALVRPAAVFVDGPCLALLRDAASRLECPVFAAVLLTPLGGGERPDPVITTAAAAAAAAGAGAGCIASWRSADELVEAAMAAASTAAAAAAAAAASAAASDPGTVRLRLQLRAPPGGEALVCFTSGTTGAPKGAVLTHAALTHQSLAKLAAVGYGAADVYLHAAPLCHVGGLSSALAALTAGARHVFAPRYSAAAAAALTRRHGVTALIAVPAMLEDLAAAVAAEPGAGDNSGRGRGDAALPSVRRLLVGGGGTRPQLEPLVRRLFPNATVSSAYGMTEAASSITFLCPALSADGAPSRPAPGHPSGACVGVPGPGIQVSIRPLPSEDAAAPAGPASNGGGEGVVVGEVLTAGPHVMAGYWRDPEATRAALLPGGWLRTGDLGYLDGGGRLWLVGRAKDTVKSGGENVHAREVERALESHAAVAAAAVVGLLHERLGEVVAAAVVLRGGWAWRGETAGDGAVGGSGGASSGNGNDAGSTVTAAALQDHCRVAAGLTPFKLPRRVFAVRELPRNLSGKVLKAELKELLLRSAGPRSAL